MSLRTNGRLRVRVIRASYCGSISILNALADAEVRKVPVVKKRSVIVLRDGASVADGSSMAGTGYMPYAAAEVRMMRKVRRGFDKASRAANFRRTEFFGREEESEVSRDGASGGSSGITSPSLCSTGLSLEGILFGLLLTGDHDG